MATFQAPPGFCQKPDPHLTIGIFIPGFARIPKDTVPIGWKKTQEYSTRYEVLLRCAAPLAAAATMAVEDLRSGRGRPKKRPPAPPTPFGPAAGTKRAAGAFDCASRGSNPPAGWKGGTPEKLPPRTLSGNSKDTPRKLRPKLSLSGTRGHKGIQETSSGTIPKALGRQDHQTLRNPIG